MVLVGRYLLCEKTYSGVAPTNDIHAAAAVRALRKTMMVIQYREEFAVKVLKM